MSYNKVILEGRLTANPELKKTSSDVEYCNFSIAVDRDYKSGEDRIADFINIKAWRKSAEFICKYFKKGSPILIDGRIEVDKKSMDDGSTRYFTSVVVDRATFTISDKGGAFDSSNSVQAASKEPEFSDIDDDGDLPF